MSNVLATAQTEDLVASMSKPLRSVYKTIVHEVEVLATNAVMTYWKMGEYAKNVTNNERKYGEAAMETLGKALRGVLPDPQMIWRCRRLANAFTQEELAGLMERETSGGKKITVSHLDQVTELAPRLRNQMIKRIFKEDLSVRDLRGILQEKLGTRSGGGRPVAVPTTVTGGLSQIEKYSGEIHKRLSVWRTGVFNRIKDTPPDDVTSKTVKVIKSTKKQVEQMVEDGEYILQKLEESEDRVNKVLSQRKDSASSNGKPRRPKKKTSKKTTTTAEKGQTKKKRATASGNSSERIAAAKKKRKASKKKKGRLPQPA